MPGRHGTYRLATTCEKFMERINAGNYDYIVMSQATQDSPDSPYWYPIYAWVKSDPALKLVVKEPDIVPQPDYVFKVVGELNPKYCPG